MKQNSTKIKVKETSLIIRKKTIFDKIREKLFRLVLGKEYYLLEELEELCRTRASVNITKIIIPKEMGKNIKKMNKNVN